MTPRDADTDTGESRGTRAQSSVLGVALVLAIVVSGSTLLVVFGGQAIGQTQGASEITRAEHSMTLFDSRVARVALGETASQSVEFGAVGSGSYEVRNGGWISVTHHNYSGANNDVELYNGSLGSVAYETDDTTVAYQGGGVWRSPTDGDGSTMVSPPELHYRSATLTLPVVRVNGSDSASGGQRALIERANDTRRVYPNGSDDYPSGSGYANPVTNGTVTIAVHSDFYRAWGAYFRSRTDGNVSVYDGNRTVHVELQSGQAVGTFEMPDRSNGVRVRGMDSGHPINEFTTTISEGNNFNNLYFSYYAGSGNQEFEVMIHVPSGTQVECDDGSFTKQISGGDLQMDVYYADDDTDGHHAWTNDSIAPFSGPIQFQCSGDAAELAVDFTSGQTTMTYGSMSTTNDPSFWQYDWNGSVDADADFNHSVAGEPTRFNAGETTDLEHLMGHYFGLLAPDMTLSVNYGPGGSPRVNTGDSSGVLEYESTAGRYVTYLHVTENRVRVTFS